MAHAREGWSSHRPPNSNKYGSHAENFFDIAIKWLKYISHRYSEFYSFNLYLQIIIHWDALVS